MNKFKNWLIAGAISLSFTACDQLLDVKPVLSIDEQTALSTEADVKVTLTGAFDGLSSGNLYGGGYWYANELVGDGGEVRFGGTYATMDEIWRKAVTTSNGVILGIWADSYATINRANHVLANLDKVSAANKDSFEGQARFVRGAVYFELVKLFGKTWGDGDNNTNPGVPIVLTPTKAVTEADYKARNSVAAVYAQVIEDLTTAVNQLPDNTDDTFVSKYAAKALLSRVYLMQRDYAKARDAANAVIESGAFGLAGSFEEAFMDDTNGDEAIFRIVVSEQDGVNDMNTFFASTLSNGRGDVRVQTAHTSLYEPDDARLGFFESTSKGKFTLKFADQFGDVVPFRLAEMYLTRAEANQRLGTSVGDTPLNDVNKIRNRAGLVNLGSVTLAQILKERHLELAFEGVQLDDVKRTGGTVGTLNYNANALVLPIPQREMDTNDKLVQNPGYGG